MVKEYLSHILFPSSNPSGISKMETTILSLIDNPVNTINASNISNRQKALIKVKESIIVNDLGAGSKFRLDSKRIIGRIAKHASIRPKYGQFYASIIKELNLDVAIELGTSFGLGTAYLASVASKVLTIEGCESTAEIARRTFKTLNLKNIDLRVGEFSEILSKLNCDNQQPTFVYIDGNHQYEPTLAYFEFFRKRLPANSILIFDDIYWSAEMRKAWRLIQQEPFFSVDLFKIGLVVLAEKSEPVALRKRL